MPPRRRLTAKVQQGSAMTVIEPSGHPIDAEVTVADRQGQFAKKQAFFVRLNNGTRAIEDEKERERYIAQRWGRD